MGLVEVKVYYLDSNSRVQHKSQNYNFSTLYILSPAYLVTYILPTMIPEQIDTTTPILVGIAEHI